MKHNFIVILFLVVATVVSAQNSFEGAISFNLKFTSKDTLEISKMEKENNFRSMEGDSVRLLYSKFGHIKHHYLNSSASGIAYYLISPDGNRIRKLKSGISDAPSDRVKFLGKFTAPNQIVLGKDCQCYQYKFKSLTAKYITETLCFSTSTPKVDYRLFNAEKNRVDRDFFETAERPYLKHTIETATSLTEYIAYKITTENIPIQEFK